MKGGRPNNRGILGGTIKLNYVLPLPGSSDMHQTERSPFGEQQKCNRRVIITPLGSLPIHVLLTTAH